MILPFQLGVVLLKNLWSERDNLHEIFIAEFTCYRSEDTSSTRRFIIFNDNRCVFIKTDVGTIVTTNTTSTTYDNCFHNLALLDNATGCSTFYGTHDNIPDVRSFTTRTTQNFDAH
ncbi:hypothetical protein MA20_48305 [Bradyrhizobium japonicum]|uniref:Uncharacterized protein n=1 Tax=Bradyrhizobium japonicum TaxID=375 RepID=A0A0A3XHN7_BRAJP|nr:hypothetical protein MA20_48305 [Bradyrhizobium japonicum]